MLTVLKYLLFVLIFIIAILFAILNTSMGNKLGYFYLSDTASEKAHLNIKVIAINLYDYPHVSTELLIEDKYTLELHGKIEDFKRLNMNYTITSNCIESNVCSIDDVVSINGEIQGAFRNITIKGKGEILDGNITFEGLKKRRSFDNIDIVISDINSSKLLTLLDQKVLLKGKANAHIHFDTIGKKGKKGTITYDVKDNNFSGLPVALNTRVDIIDDKHTFTINLTTPTATLNVIKGKYDRELKQATAVYVLDIEELADLENILKLKATGPFYAVGEIKYDKKIKMQGFSKSFGGALDIFYENKKFDFYLNDVPFNPMMQRLSFSPLWDAKMLGKIEYDLRQKVMQTKVKLKEVKFIQKDIVNVVHQQFGYNLNEEIFENSSFEATYKDKVLSSVLKIANEKNHLILRNTELNSLQKSIDTTIDFKIDKHHIEGKLYARNDGYTDHSLYTYLKFDGIVEKYYQLKLDGSLSDKWANMDYTLGAARCPSHVCTIEDNIDIKGHVHGPLKRLYIKGKGKALNGHVNFNALKINDELQDVHLKMTDIHAKKLSTLMGQPTLPPGRANIDANFKYLSKEHKKGTLTYVLKDGNYEKMPLNLTTHIIALDDHYTFTADIDLNGAKANLSKGVYDEDKNITRAFYKLNIKDLTKLEKLFGHTYKGPFHAMGNIHYTDKFQVRGLSKTFGGMTDFLYKEDMLYIDFEDASFKYIMNLFPYPVILDADTKGSVNYDFIKESLIISTKLNNAKFLPSDLVNSAYKKAGVYLPNEVFTKSTLNLTYKNKIILGNLKLANETGHIYLTNANIDTANKTVDAYFDVNLQKQEFTGKVYGSLDKPKVNLNMQKLIKHEMDKQFDSIMGKNNREMMEAMPMSGMAKDMASGVGAGFMGIFF